MKPGYLLPLVLLAALAPSAAGQFRRIIAINDDVNAGTGIQLYLDFSPQDVIPPAIPTVPPPGGSNDAHVIVPGVTGFGTSSSGFVATVSLAINNELRAQNFPLTYFTTFRPKENPNETAHDGTIEVNSPVQLYSVFASGSGGMPPTTLVPPPPGIGFNATLSDLTELLGAHPGSPNAQMNVNFRDPANEDFHLVEVPIPGGLRLDFFGQPLVGIALLGANVYNPLAIANLPFGGSLDIGSGGGQGVFAIADGISMAVNPFLDPLFVTNGMGQMTFDIPSLSPSVAGANVALQAVLADPTFPIPFAISQAADVNYALGKSMPLPTGNDGTATVTFNPGTTFEFYGTSYTQAHINANGFITFGQPTSNPTPFAVDPVQGLMLEPTVFANWSDWDPSVSSPVVYTEFGAEVRIRWGSQGMPMSHAGGGDRAIFSATLVTRAAPSTIPPSQRESVDGVGSITSNSGSIFLDYLLLDDPTLTPGRFDSLTGVTPGMVPNAAGIPSRDLGRIVLPMQPLNSIVEQHADPTSPVNPASVLNVPNGGPQAYHNGQILQGRSVGFFPVDLAGMTGMMAIPQRARGNDLTGQTIDTVSVMQSAAGPITFFIIGHFKNLFARPAAAPTPQVFFRRSGGMLTIPLIIDAVTDSTGASNAPVTIPPPPGFRELEGAQIQIPPGAIGTPLVGVMLDLVVVFPNGETFTRPNAVMVIP